MTNALRSCSLQVICYVTVTNEVKWVEVGMESATITKVGTEGIGDILRKVFVFDFY